MCSNVFSLRMFLYLEEEEEEEEEEDVLECVFS